VGGKIRPRLFLCAKGNRLNLALIGFRCCGKTTVGGALAQILAFEFVDTDRLVEEISGFAVHRLVSLKGWAEFRKFEARALEMALSRDSRVIATGGGVVLSQENVSKMRKRARVFWLCAPAELIQSRMAESGGALIRPGLTQDDALGEVPALLEARMPLYRDAADHIVNAGHVKPEHVAREICELMKSQADCERSA
jgi:shikimate kinase